MEEELYELISQYGVKLAGSKGKLQYKLKNDRGETKTGELPKDKNHHKFLHDLIHVSKIEKRSEDFDDRQTVMGFLNEEKNQESRSL